MNRPIPPDEECEGPSRRSGAAVDGRRAGELRRERGLAIAVLVGWFCGVAGAQPRVTIGGGADATGHLFDWTVDHEHSSPIVRVEFPNHRADLFSVPDGWTGELKVLDAGGDDRGISVGRAHNEDAGIRGGAPRRFRMRIGPHAALLGVRPGRGVVRVRFADGMELEAPAEVPVRESWLARQALPVVVVLLVVGVAIRQTRGRNRRLAGGDGVGTVETGK